MKALALAALAATLPPYLLTGCGGTRQSGPIGGCQGVSLGGEASFQPRGGVVYRHPVLLGTGQTMPGPFIVLLWGDGPDGGAASSVTQAQACGLISDAGSPATFSLAPQSVQFSLQDTLLAGPFQSTITDTITDSSGMAQLTEDVAGGGDLNTLGPPCLTGDFTADLTAVDSFNGTPLDGGTTSRLTGQFGIPFCP